MVQRKEAKPESDPGPRLKAGVSEPRAARVEQAVGGLGLVFIFKALLEARPQSLTTLPHGWISTAPRIITINTRLGRG